MSDIALTDVYREPARPALPMLPKCLLIFGGLLVVSLLIWQGLAAKGAPDPLSEQSSRFSATFDIAVLVFREGLECVLVLSAITASMVGANAAHKKPVAAGVGAGFLATIATWFIAVAIIADLTQNVSALDIQAATGLLAVVVLLVVMNWFFHKIYWGRWITLHGKKKKSLLNEANGSLITRRRLFWGLGLLGFSAFYREGFEVVLFLQSYRLKMGSSVVLGGAAIGMFFSALVALLTFVAHHRLPYRRMLVLTGVMLGFVLIVMVGEQAQEMQLARWISTTPIKALADFTPNWAGVWFSFFPTVETIAAQILAAAIVILSYFLARSEMRNAPAQVAAPINR